MRSPSAHNAEANRTSVRDPLPPRLVCSVAVVGSAAPTTALRSPLSCVCAAPQRHASSYAFLSMASIPDAPCMSAAADGSEQDACRPQTRPEASPGIGFKVRSRPCVRAFRRSGACAIQRGEPRLAIRNWLPATRGQPGNFSQLVPPAYPPVRPAARRVQVLFARSVIASSAGHGTSMPCRRPFGVSFNLYGPRSSV